MRFKEAWEAIEKGKKIRQIWWGRGRYWKRCKSGYVEISRNCPPCILEATWEYGTFSGFDNDWEIVEDKKHKCIVCGLLFDNEFNADQCPCEEHNKAKLADKKEDYSKYSTCCPKCYGWECDGHCLTPKDEEPAMITANFRGFPNANVAEPEKINFANCEDCKVDDCKGYCLKPTDEELNKEVAELNEQKRQRNGLKTAQGLRDYGLRKERGEVNETNCHSKGCLHCGHLVMVHGQGVATIKCRLQND